MDNKTLNKWFLFSFILATSYSVTWNTKILSTITLLFNINFLIILCASSDSTAFQNTIKNLSFSFSLCLKHCSVNLSWWVLRLMQLRELCLLQDSYFLVISASIHVLVDHVVIRVLSTVLRIIIYFYMLLAWSYWLQTVPL